MAGYVGIPRMADYCASKWAAVGFDESIRNELWKEGIDGVRTLCVCPKYVCVYTFFVCVFVWWVVVWMSGWVECVFV